MNDRPKGYKMTNEQKVKEVQNDKWMIGQRVTKWQMNDRPKGYKMTNEQ